MEEFFFRALLQTRLAAWFRSEVTGVALMALLFGLAHAPGFILRHAGLEEAIGANPSPADSIAYAIVVLSVGGILFGIVWARTKNLFAVMIIHAAPICNLRGGRFAAELRAVESETCSHVSDLATFGTAGCVGFPRIVLESG